MNKLKSLHKLFALLFAFSFPGMAVAQTAPSPVPSYESTFSVGFGTQKITAPPQSTSSYFVTTGGNSNGQVAKSRVFTISPTTLGTSATTNYTFCPGRACTITQITAYALTKPSGTGDVTVQVFKNSTSSNAVCSSYDLNGLTNATGSTVAITGNSSLSATDGFVIQTVTGASIGSAANVTVTVECLMLDY